jgi:hypothetical protein
MTKPVLTYEKLLEINKFFEGLNSKGKLEVMLENCYVENGNFYDYDGNKLEPDDEIIKEDKEVIRRLLDD